MRRRAIITVGLGFGDEGKGATVDFLVRRYESDLVVRYCGGCQAGHNVQLPDGRRHTFSQFGAGTLAGARTWLGPAMIVEPLALRREAEHLETLGITGPGHGLTIHARCLVATPWLRLANRVRELARGDGRHGSCGQGVGECRAYWLKHGADAVFAADLREPVTLRSKLELQRQRILLDLQGCLDRLDDRDLQPLGPWDISADEIASDLETALPDGVAITEAVPSSRMAILEGAQGILLDEYHGFPPHTTWSTVTPHHAWELIEQLGVDEVAVLGLTRAYLTRHGAGPLPTYSAELTSRLPDPGNPTNPWQGSLRCGWLDVPLLRYAMAAAGRLDGLVVNHLDEIAEGGCLVAEAWSNGPLVPSMVPRRSTQERMARQLAEAVPMLRPSDVDGLLAMLAALVPVCVTGHGPSHEDRRMGGMAFRKRRPA